VRRAHAGKTRDPLQLLSFEGGLETLPRALAKALPPDTIQYACAVSRIEKTADGYIVRTETGETLQAGHVILAVPAPVAAGLLEPIVSAVCEPLRQIPYNGIAVVHTAFQRPALNHALDGFGFLVPRRERLALLGSIWASSLFPDRVPRDQVLLANFIGGAHHPEIVAWNDAQILLQVLADLQTVFQSDTLTPAYQRVLRYPNALPQYTLGHGKRVAQIETLLTAHPNIALCGNYLHGIALNECVKSGLAAATRCLTMPAG
jgi:oxygen-dependent protoporphyrinogen oxidase